MPWVNIAGTNTAIDANNKRIGMINFKYLLLSLSCIALTKGKVLSEIDLWLTEAANNSIFPLPAFNSSFNCKVFFNRSEICGKKRPIISLA